MVQWRRSDGLVIRCQVSSEPAVGFWVIGLVYLNPFALAADLVSCQKAGLYRQEQTELDVACYALLQRIGLSYAHNADGMNQSPACEETRTQKALLANLILDAHQRDKNRDAEKIIIVPHHEVVST